MPVQLFHTGSALHKRKYRAKARYLRMAVKSSPERRVGPAYEQPSVLLQCDFDVNTSRQIQAHQGVNGFVGWINDVHQTLVRADFELVA